MAIDERDIAELHILTAGKKGTSTLRLTSRRLIGRIDRGLMGRADTIIAIEAIDSVFTGWRRHPVLAGLAVFFALAGLVALMTEGMAVAVVALFIALLCAIGFFVVRPAQLLVHSGTQIVGGVPSSVGEAEAFTEQLVAAMAAARRGGGVTGSSIGG